MGRPTKPASLRVRHELTKEEKQIMAEKESELSGGNDLVKNIPNELNGNHMAIEYYKFITRELEVSEILSNLDIPILTSICLCLTRMKEADEQITKIGVVYAVADKDGNINYKKNPAVDVYNAFLTQFKTLGTQLGLSPSSRAALAELNVNKKEESEDELLSILRGD